MCGSAIERDSVGLHVHRGTSAAIREPTPRRTRSRSARHATDCEKSFSSNSSLGQVCWRRNVLGEPRVASRAAEYGSAFCRSRRPFPVHLPFPKVHLMNRETRSGGVGKVDGLLVPGSERKGCHSETVFRSEFSDLFLDPQIRAPESFFQRYLWFPSQYFFETRVI